jgi:nitrile hydratase
MNGVHDLGGMHGFGRVDVEPDEPVFHADWERRIFGIQRVLKYRGLPARSDTWRYDLECLEPAVYLSSSYYERWVLAVEDGLVRRGVLTRAELDRRRRELVAATAASPSNSDAQTADAMFTRLTGGARTSIDVDRAPRFGIDDAVVARNTHHSGHTRLPRYVRGRRGVVDRVYGAYLLPEAAAAGDPPTPDYVYGVRFAAGELWGEPAEPNAVVVIDLFEQYLLPG